MIYSRVSWKEVRIDLARLQIGTVEVLWGVRGWSRYLILFVLYLVSLEQRRREGSPESHSNLARLGWTGWGIIIGISIYMHARCYLTDLSGLYRFWSYIRLSHFIIWVMLHESKKAVEPCAN